MPIYRYRCVKCGHEADEFRAIADRDDAPLCHDKYMERVITPPMVSVFESYTTVAADRETGRTMTIRNKDEHRAFLARNGFEEVGNDRSMAPKPEEQIKDERARWKDSPCAPMVDVEKLKRDGFISEDLTA